MPHCTIRHFIPILGIRILSPTFILALLLVVAPLSFSEIDHTLDASVTLSTGYSSEKVRTRDDPSDYWAIGGLSMLSYTLTGKGKLVKGQMRLAITGTAMDEGEGALLLEVSRAYIRSKIPFNDRYGIQLEMGKNVLAWGEGSYYNAGDIIVGVKPKTTNLSSADFRDYAIWNMRFFIPLTAFIYLEPIFVIPEQRFLVSDTSAPIIVPTIDVEDSGAGARFHFETGLVQWELGGYSRFMTQQFDYFFSIAIPTVVRLYAAASSSVDYSPDAVAMPTQFETQTAVSGGILYNVGLQNGGTVSLQPELLYQDYETWLQMNCSWFPIRTLGIILRGDIAISSQEYRVLLGPQWEPEAGFSLSIFSSSHIDVDSDDTQIYTGLVVSARYKY